MARWSGSTITSISNCDIFMTVQRGIGIWLRRLLLVFVDFTRGTNLASRLSGFCLIENLIGFWIIFGLILRLYRKKFLFRISHKLKIGSRLCLKPTVNGLCWYKISYGRERSFNMTKRMPVFRIHRVTPSYIGETKQTKIWDAIYSHGGQDLMLLFHDTVKPIIG